MAELALGAFAATLLLGAWLATICLRPHGRPQPWLRAAHGGLGGLGTVLAAIALLHAERPVSTLVWEAAALVVAALILGLVFWRRAASLGPSRGMVLVMHALFGATGAAILSGWLLQ